jgi:hypothetical protein
MILTTFSEKRGCAATTNSYNKGGSAGFFKQLSSPSQHSCRASLNSNKARWINTKNNPSRLFSISHSPAFDTLLDSKYLNKQGGVKIW